LDGFEAGEGAFVVEVVEVLVGLANLRGEVDGVGVFVGFGNLCSAVESVDAFLRAGWSCRQESDKEKTQSFDAAFYR
jgi:hypothetical protein